LGFIIFVGTYLSDEDFIGEGAVDVGGIEEGDAGVDRVADEADHVRLGLRRAVDGRHAHAAQSLGRHLQSLRAQLHSGNHHGSCLTGLCNQ